MAVADLGFVVRLWWVVASKRCVWLVGMVVAEGVLWVCWVACFVSEKREMKRKREKEMMKN